MANDPAIAGPQLVKINKKTGANAYTLYHPQTGAEMVLYNGALGLPWTTKPSEVHKYTDKGVQDDSAGTYYLLSDILKYTNAAIDDFGGVLEFKGSSTPAALSNMQDISKGEVWIVSNDTASVKSVYWTDNYSGSTITWHPFPNNTLFVYTGEQAKAISDSNQGTGSSVTRGWVPLGGNNDIYALKTEAIHSIIGDGTGLKFGYASESTTTHQVTGVGVVGTTGVGVTNIVTTISSSSSTAIPTEGAVYNFASSAGQVKVTAATEGYLIGVASYSDSDSSTAKAPLDFKIHVTNGKTDTPTLGANISGKAATAGTADKVANAFTVAGQAFDGQTAKTVAVGNGLTATPSGNTTTISVGEGDGITVDENGISVNVGNGLAYSNDQIVATATAGLKVTANGIGINNSITSGVYSAVAVNQYGLATAGAQSIIFAKGMNDPDLGDLVVGGLAFIGTSTAAADTYTGTAKSTGTVGVMDDAE